MIKRGNQWCLRRRVAVEFQQVESRSEVWISLKTDSRRLACEKALAVWNEQVAAWKACLSGHDDDAVKHFEVVQDLASAKGVRYMSLDQVVQLAIDTLLDRIETGGLTANSANKDLIHLGEVLKTVNKMKRLGLDLPHDGLAFKEGEKSAPPLFSTGLKSPVAFERKVA
ncbi:Phage integrase [Sulfitobacter donghicola DSW-25 = KCTC 12864 = JCM 14565]|nr:Phage integrase [Sulfitobacter donghicola DSW-25 = KCTC 12864 = JCM 14565]